ncbi:hypothetical protein K450DRAFT_225638 [Umbelopsis ramanniana AG]|uniref:Rab-GAP TBC domain-containing protein n=1 Tax=Umbelopsis ramanniana AG TaxID=1314678 RepID=A0AAD5EFK3_UMBRA|nr:uncharacterized protein K450DRAFT_225638 [Umbelopsis ramanniana AG]KAI8582958.1 hypothetical protein K450DRAFT_225638 [Umbelopsis ramanniana AG]
MIKNLALDPGVPIPGVLVDTSALNSPDSVRKSQLLDALSTLNNGSSAYNEETFSLLKAYQQNPSPANMQEILQRDDIHSPSQSPMPSKSLPPQRLTVAPRPRKNTSMTIAQRRRIPNSIPNFRLYPQIRSDPTEDDVHESPLLKRLEEENAKLPPQESTEFILAQIERQNALLDEDPKSICIQSNELKAHFSTLQSLITHSTNTPYQEDEDVQASIPTSPLKTAFQYTPAADDGNIDWEFWGALIDDFPTVALKLSHLVSAKLRAGVPHKLRGLVWQAMSQAASLNLEAVYPQLIQERSPYDRVIQRDLARTFPHVEMFKKEGGDGQKAMERVLKAYSLYDSYVGYCQGLAFLVGPLLMNMPEQKAFCVFVRLMETYDMRTMFTLNMEGLQLRLYQFTSLLAQILPKLSDHLDALSVHPPMYASQWFLTLFAYSFPISLVMRIYDIIFAEGAAETIMRIAIAMLKKSEDDILAMGEFEEVLDFLTSKLHEPYQSNSTLVIADAMALSDVITRDKLDQLSDQYLADIEEEKKRSQEVMAVRLNFWKRASSTTSDETKKKNRESGKWLWDSTGPTKDKRAASDEEKETKRSAKKRESIGSLIRVQSPRAADAVLHQQIEDLVSALSQLQKDNMQISQEKLQCMMQNSDLTAERDQLQRKVLQLEKAKSLNHDTVNCDRDEQPSGSSGDDSTSVASDSSHEATSTATSFTEYTRLTMVSSVPDGDDLRCQRDPESRLEVFELQQKLEKICEELADLKSQHEMAKDAQMALVEKLLSMKDEHDQLDQARLQAEKEKATMAQEYDNLRRLMAERERVHLEANKAAKPRSERNRRPAVVDSTASPPLGRRHTTHIANRQPFESDDERCSELESMLAEAKLRIVELETASSPKPRTTLDKSPLSILASGGRLSLDNSNVPLSPIDLRLGRASTDSIPARAPLPKRSSLYGRMWNALGSQPST